MESFNIIVTNQRMVFAQITNQMIKDEAARNRGQGIGGVFRAMTSGFTLWQRYLQIPPDQALQENPGNFAVFLNQVRKVKYNGASGGLQIGINVGGDDDEPAKLEIETVGGKYNFGIATQFQQQTHQVLKGAGLIK